MDLDKVQIALQTRAEAPQRMRRMGRLDASLSEEPKEPPFHGSRPHMSTAGAHDHGKKHSCLRQIEPSDRKRLGSRWRKTKVRLVVGAGRLEVDAQGGWVVQRPAQQRPHAPDGVEAPNPPRSGVGQRRCSSMVSLGQGAYGALCSLSPIRKTREWTGV